MIGGCWQRTGEFARVALLLITPGRRLPGRLAIVLGGILLHGLSVRPVLARLKPGEPAEE